MIIAAPTVTPTRCPTPISASERLAPNSVPPDPTRKAVDTSLPRTFIAASRENPAEASEPTTIARRPRRLLSTPSAPSGPSVDSPTLSTSAAATPSG